MDASPCKARFTRTPAACSLHSCSWWSYNQASPLIPHPRHPVVSRPCCTLQKSASPARLGTAQLHDLAGFRGPRAARQTENSTEIRERVFVVKVSRYVGLQRLRLFGNGTVPWQDPLTWLGVGLVEWCVEVRRWSQTERCAYFGAANVEAGTSLERRICNSSQGLVPCCNDRGQWRVKFCLYA